MDQGSNYQITKIGVINIFPAIISHTIVGIQKTLATDTEKKLLSSWNKQSKLKIEI